jgi:hypothetical protein
MQQSQTFFQSFFFFLPLQIFLKVLEKTVRKNPTAERNTVSALEAGTHTVGILFFQHFALASQNEDGEVICPLFCLPVACRFIQSANIISAFELQYSFQNPIGIMADLNKS